MPTQYRNKKTGHIHQPVPGGRHEKRLKASDDYEAVSKTEADKAGKTEPKAEAKK